MFCIVVNEAMSFIKQWGWEVKQEVRITCTLLVIVIFHLPLASVKQQLDITEKEINENIY